MNQSIRLLLAALSLGFFALAGPASANELIPPFKVNFHFGFDVQCLNQPQPSAPWWAYFPQDSHHPPATGSVYPNWPTQFPPDAQSNLGGPANRPNVTRGYAPTPFQPVGWRQPAAPGYWYSR